MFKDIVTNDPRAGPASLSIGNSVREPIWKADPAFINSGRVKHLRRLELSELALRTPQDITAFESRTKMKFITG